jgi:hypothetical protein
MILFHAPREAPPARGHSPIAVFWRRAAAFLVASALWTVPAPAQECWTLEADLPVRRSNNATAYFERDGQGYLFSCLGIDETKAFSGIQRDAWVYDIKARMWTQAPDVLGPARIAASASLLRGKIHVVGGYEVLANGNEISRDSLSLYDPETNSWSAGPPALLPIDDHVQAVRQDRWLYVVSGWSGGAGDPTPGNVAAVQVFDAETNSWSLATNYPVPVFGHAGCLIGDELFIFDGVTDGGSFRLRNIFFRGQIDPTDPLLITWTVGGPNGTHPGEASYRGGVQPLEGGPLLLGGSNNPYNYNGIGYNGMPSEPLERVLALNPADGSAWTPAGCLETPLAPVMDLRGMVWSGSTAPGECFYWLIGGMEADQTVSNKVQRLDPFAGMAAVENWEAFER